MRTEIESKAPYTRAPGPASEQTTVQPAGGTIISHLCDQCAEFRGRISKLEQELAMLQSAQSGYLSHAKGLAPIE